MNDMKLDTRKLRQLREARAWSQERLAEAAGLSSRTVQRVEADGRAAAETTLALAAALDVPVDILAAADAATPAATSADIPQPVAPADIPRAAALQRRPSRHLLIYLLVSAALLYRDLHPDGQLDWAAWPIAGWGLALLLRARRRHARPPGRRPLASGLNPDGG